MMFCKTSIVYLITTLLLLNFLTCAELNLNSQTNASLKYKHMSIYEANELSLMRKNFWKKTPKLDLLQKTEMEKIQRIESEKAAKRLTNESMKVCVDSVGKTKQKQKFIPNPFIDGLDPGIMVQFTRNEPCIQKSGFLYMLEKAKSYDFELEFVKIFVKMTQESISFQASTDDKSKFQEIPMRNIVKIGKKYKSSFCFELMFHENTEAEQIAINNFKRGAATICGKNIPQMKDWISGILKMKGCIYKKPTVADFQVINEVLQNKQEIQKAIAKHGRILAPTTYNSNIWPNRIHMKKTKTTKSYKKVPQIEKKMTKETKQTKTTVTKAITEIHETIQANIQRENLVKKKLVDKIKKIKKKTKMLKNKRKSYRIYLKQEKLLKVKAKPNTEPN